MLGIGDNILSAAIEGNRKEIKKKKKDGRLVLEKGLAKVGSNGGVITSLWGVLITHFL